MMCSGTKNLYTTKQEFKKDLDLVQTDLTCSTFDISFNPEIDQ